MSCTLEKVLGDAWTLLERLKEHDTAAEGLIEQSGALSQRVHSMREVGNALPDKVRTQTNGVLGSTAVHTRHRIIKARLNPDKHQKCSIYPTLLHPAICNRVKQICQIYENMQNLFDKTTTSYVSAIKMYARHSLFTFLLLAYF